MGHGSWVCVTSEEDGALRGTAVGVGLQSGQKMVGALSLGEVQEARVVVANAEQLGLGQLLEQLSVTARWGGSPRCAPP